MIVVHGLLLFLVTGMFVTHLHCMLVTCIERLEKLSCSVS